MAQHSDAVELACRVVSGRFATELKKTPGDAHGAWNRAVIRLRDSGRLDRHFDRIPTRVIYGAAKALCFLRLGINRQVDLLPYPLLANHPGSRAVH